MPSSRRILAIASVGLAICAVPATSRAQSQGLDKETAQDVMRSGSHGVAGLDGALVEINELRAVASAMSRDAVLAQKILDFARRGDKAGITALIQPCAPRTKLEVTRVVDFTVEIKGRTYFFCWSNSNGCGGGANFVLAMT